MRDFKNDRPFTANDVEAVVTSFNQGSMILEAIESLCSQTLLPAKIFLVDDGSTDENSIRILEQIESDFRLSVPIEILHQTNKGVSAARNAGIRKVQTPLVLVLDGDDRLEPAYIEKVSNLLKKDSSIIAASSWLHTFGILDAEVRPAGGNITAFLSRNCCPATHIFRRQIWEECGGYDESMLSGFEDWDFFLSMLETRSGAHIKILKEALIDYRTAPASFNVRSMEKRLELMEFLIRKHKAIYEKYLTKAILGIESISMSRLQGWEEEICHGLRKNQTLSKASSNFMEHPTYGDGGMAAAVRIASIHKENQSFMGMDL